MSGATLVANSQFLRKVISIPLVSAAVLVASTAIAGAQLSTFAGNAQHTNLYTPTARHLNRTKWSTQIDTSNSGAFAHYGEPLVTAANTVIVPVLTSVSGSTTGTVTINVYDGATGTFKYNLVTDYTFPTFGWVPEYNPVVVGARLYYPGAGGTVYYVDNIDSNSPTAPTQLCFYGTLANYTTNAATYNSTIAIDTPMTADSHGNIFFGFRAQGTPIAPFGVNGSSQPLSGYARISSTGVGAFVTVNNMTGDAAMAMDSHNVAPALSNDESTLYVVAKQYNYAYNAYICGLDSTTLATKYNRHIIDPRPGGSAAGPIDDSTSSPLVGPDGDVYMGMFVTPYNGSRGYLAHYSSDLSVVKTPGAFGWDFTPGIVPASMVPSYHGKSSYLLFCKYNNYDTGGGSEDGGDEINTVAILDPEDETQVDWHPQAAGMTEMREVLTMIGPTANDEIQETNSVREWCVNATAVNPGTDSVSFNSEDGRTYRWNLTQNSLSECLVLTQGFGVPYVPAFIGPDGTVYTFNGTFLFANSDVPGITVTLDSDHADARTTVVGDTVKFTANVTDPSATGASTVTFTDVQYDNYTPLAPVTLGTVPLVSGHASLSTSALKAGVYNSGADVYLGSHFITATYNQTGTYSSTNPSITRVQKLHYFASTTTANTPNPTVNYGNPVTLNANVASVPVSSGDPPKAMVAFVDSNGAVVGQAHVDGTGLATTTITTLSPGVHTLTAVFNGDTEFATSSSSTFTVSVKGLVSFVANPLALRGGATSSGSLTLSPAAGVSGEPVALQSNSPFATVTTPSTIASGQTVGTFTIHTNNSTNNVQSATITATDGNSLSQTLTIQPANYTSYVTQTVPSSMVCGQTYPVSMSYKNTGTTTWTSAAGYKLQARSPTNNVNFGMNRIPLTNGPITNGGTGVFQANVIGPATAGTYYFQWEPILDPIGQNFGVSTPAVMVTVTKNADASQYVGDTAPTSIASGADFFPTITFKNVGTNTWSTAAGYQLVSQNPNSNTTWGPSTVALPSSVAAGANAVFAPHLTAPSTPGTYQFQWSMIHGSALFGDLPASKSIVVTQGSDGAHFVSQSVPVSVGPGTTFSASVTMQNSGVTTWSTAGGYSLKSENPAGNSNWGVSSVAVTGSVAPGANDTFSTTFTAPITAGTYNFQWRMTNGTEFGDLSTNVAITVSADSAQYISTSSGPVSIVAGRDFYVQYTMKNNGTTTWSTANGYSMRTLANPTSTWTRTNLFFPTSNSYGPGASLLITGQCTSPVTPGTYALQWQMNVHGVLFGQKTPLVSVVVTQGPDDANFVSMTGVQNTVLHGTSFNATITMQNLGSATWDGTYVLQSQSPAANTTWGVATIPVVGTVAPNASKSFTQTFTAPSTPGTYIFQWRMFHTGNAVFGAPTPSISVKVT